MNNWTGIGRLTKDPQIGAIPSTQTVVAKFTMAIDDGYGEKKRTNFIPVTSFGKTAENCERFLKKGRLVAVEGKIQTGSYDKQDGTKVYTTDVIANRVEFLEWDKPATGSGSKPVEAPAEIPEGFQMIQNDDIPF